MAKILINDQRKALIDSNGKAYVIGNMAAAEGVQPLAIGAAAGKVLRLERYGKSTQAGTPTPSSPVDIICNNGPVGEAVHANPEAVTIGRQTQLTLDATRISAYISDVGIWKSSSDSYSIKVPVTVGKKYRIVWTNTNSAVVGTIFRYGFTDTPTPSNTNQLTQWERTSPQDLPEVEITADCDYLIIQNGASLMAANISNGRMLVYEVDEQTASVPDLLKAGNYQDEADIVSGKITRRCGVKVLDGTEAWVKLTVSGQVLFYINAAGPSIPGNADTLCTIATGAAEDWSSPADSIVVRSNGNFGFLKPSNMTASNTAQDWKDYLAGEYANGTPVVIVYPLATETADQAERQSLSTASGVNTVESSVADAQIKIVYKI